MGTGKEDGSILGLTSAGPRGRDGIPERPSCKYPASMLRDDVWKMTMPLSRASITCFCDLIFSVSAQCRRQFVKIR